MQFRHFFLFVICGIFLFSAAEAVAQKITTNEDGEKIIIYPDGSWKYFNDISDSTGEEKQETKKRKKNKIDPIADDEDTLAEEENARRAATRSAERAAAAVVKAQAKLEDASMKLAVTESELETAEKMEDTPVDEILDLKEKVDLAGEALKLAKSDLKASRKRAKKLKKMIDMPKAKRDKLLAKMEEERPEIEAVGPKVRSRPPGEEVAEDEAFKNTQPYISPQKTFAEYNREKDVIFNPPAPPCNLTFDGVDEFSGKSRRDVAAGILFTHTSDQLRPYMKGGEYITCKGYLSAISGGFKLLYLHFEILSENAQREFGILEKGSLLSIKFIDGSYAKLSNNKSDQGLSNSLEKSVTYRAQYLIDASTEKALRKKEVDKIRVVWGTGYEDYEVYDLDFFVDQFECLDGEQ